MKNIFRFSCFTWITGGKTAFSILLLFFSVSAFPVNGGELDAPAAPSDPVSAMWTLNDIYNMLDTRDCSISKRSGGFVDPSGGPTNSAMRSLDEIVAVSGERAPAARTGQTTSYSDALSGDDDGVLRTGVAWPETRFVDNGDNTITDKLTGLMWAKNADIAGATMTWADAVDYCATLDYGGYTDWRLPNRREMFSLINHEEAALVTWLQSHGFENVRDTYYQTGTTQVGRTDTWVVSLSNGEVTYGNKGTLRYVLPVRSGPHYDELVPGPGPTGDIDAPAGPESADSAAWTLQNLYDILDTRTTNYNKRAGPFTEASVPPSGAMRSLNNIMAMVTNRAPIMKTGMTTSYADYDDGWYKTGIAWPDPRFTDNGDGTVTDNLTGLMWTQDADLNNAEMNWNSCIEYCEALTIGGYTDWRLPSRYELSTLIHLGHPVYNLHTWLNGQGFENVQAQEYWSSTTYAPSTTRAWFANMNLGQERFNYKSQDRYVWPVRGACR